MESETSSRNIAEKRYLVVEAWKGRHSLCGPISSDAWAFFNCAGFQRESGTNKQKLIE
jgi:hypothetical protein